MKKSIMLVDDDESIREGVRHFIEAEGYTVMAMPNGKEALEHLRSNQDYCLVLTDLMMPQMTGYELLNSMAEEKINIPAVVMSGSVVFPAGYEVLKKPFSHDDLVATLKRYCG